MVRGRGLRWLKLAPLSPLLFRMNVFINLDAAISVERKNTVGLRIGSFHTRRADRHPRHGKADHIRFLRQKARDDVGRNVAFDDIVAHHAGMTSVKGLWDALLVFERGEVGV